MELVAAQPRPSAIAPRGIRGLCCVCTGNHATVLFISSSIFFFFLHLVRLPDFGELRRGDPSANQEAVNWFQNGHGQKENCSRSVVTDKQIGERTQL